MTTNFMPALNKRSGEQEIMDKKDCDIIELIKAVSQFKIINYLFSRYRCLVKKYIIQEIIKDKSIEYSFLDIGAGGCDIGIWLFKYCKKNNLKINITCLDNDERIFQYAREQCLVYDGIRVIKDDVFNLKKIGKFDFIFTNHLLHHFSDQDIYKIINLIQSNTRRVFLLNDLKRSYLSYFGFSLFAGIFLHNSFAFHDGRTSIKKGFRADEMKRITKHLKDIVIKQKVPSRIYLVGRGRVII
jgi:2-polyprenyl-3-methyl-5-hydroxy-6-metoxy-1,4-benzoquinol methylase